MFHTMRGIAVHLVWWLSLIHSPFDWLMSCCFILVCVGCKELEVEDEGRWARMEE